MAVDGVRPDPAEAATRIGMLVAECADELGPVTTVAWTGKGKS